MGTRHHILVSPVLLPFFRVVILVFFPYTFRRAQNTLGLEPAFSFAPSLPALYHPLYYWLLLHRVVLFNRESGKGLCIQPYRFWIRDYTHTCLPLLYPTFTDTLCAHAACADQCGFRCTGLSRSGPQAAALHSDYSLCRGSPFHGRHSDTPL